MSAPFLTMGSSFSPNLMKEVPSVKEEMRRVEELWAASDRVHEETRRRQSCVEWIAFHQHLAGVFRGRADHHARQQERYEALRRTLSTKPEGESDDKRISA